MGQTQSLIKYWLWQRWEQDNDKNLAKNEEWMIVVGSSIDTRSIPIIGELSTVVNE